MLPAPVMRASVEDLDSRLKENDAVIFIDRKGRRYMKMLRAGKKLLIRGEFRADELFGVEEGSRVKFSTGETFLVLRPTYADLIPHLPRASQVIYPKDTGPLLIWGDVFPGATVIEGGTGAGALTIALLRAVGPNGRVISYELREDFADAARKQRRRIFRRRAELDDQGARSLRAASTKPASIGCFSIWPSRGAHWKSRRLRCGRARCWFATCRRRCSSRTRARLLQARSDFGEIESFETLLRHWQVKGMSVRPHFRMIAHSAFIIVSRKLASRRGASARAIRRRRFRGVRRRRGGRSARLVQ